MLLFHVRQLRLIFQNVAHLQYQTSYNTLNNILTFIILLLLSRSINAATWNRNSPCKQTMKHANSRDAWYKQHGLAWSWLDKLATLVSKNGITFETANFPNIHNHVYIYPNSCKLDNSSSIRKKIEKSRAYPRDAHPLPSPHARVSLAASIPVKIHDILSDPMPPACSNAIPNYSPAVYRSVNEIKHTHALTRARARSSPLSFCPRVHSWRAGIHRRNGGARGRAPARPWILLHRPRMWGSVYEEREREGERGRKRGSRQGRVLVSFCGSRSGWKNERWVWEGGVASDFRFSRCAKPLLLPGVEERTVPR